MAENIYCKHNAISFSIYLHVNIFCTRVFFVILLKFRDSFVQCVRKQSKLNTRFSFIFRDSCKFWTNDEKTVIGISISHKSPFIFLSPHNHRLWCCLRGWNDDATSFLTSRFALHYHHCTRNDCTSFMSVEDSMKHERLYHNGCKFARPHVH